MTDFSNPSDPPQESSEATQPSGSLWVKKLPPLIVVGLIVAVLFYFFRDQLTLESLASYESELRSFKEEHFFTTIAAAFLIYVIVTGLSLPGGAALSLVYGWLFGLPAVILVSFASTAGATIAFLLSRYLLGQIIQQNFGKRLEGFNRALEREGAFYLFTLRLIPLIPFFVINVVMGLTKMRAKTFWWVSQLGMLPGTFLFIYAGSQIPTLREIADKGAGSILKPQMLVAFVLLGLFPLAIKKIVGWLRPQNSEDDLASETGESGQ